MKLCIHTFAMIAVLLCMLWPDAGKAGADDNDQLHYGIYDPEERFAASGRFAIEHVFMHWEPYDGARLRAASSYATKRNRWLMVTIEPWPAHGRSGDTLFADTIAGLYDSEIANVCSELDVLGQGVFIRWAQEMEDPTGRFPWASRDAEGFVAAYRYFVDHCRQWSHGRFFFVWSPKGLRSMSDYFPGPSYVDYVGVSVFGLEQWEIDNLGKPRDFNDYFRSVYGFASQFKKPILIAELGVQGSTSYRHLWFSELPRAREIFPLLRLIIYFNAKEPSPWPGYGNPDWRADISDFPPPA